MVKKIALFALIIFIIFNMTGCGGKQETPAGENAPNQENREQKEEQKPDTEKENRVPVPGPENEAGPEEKAETEAKKDDLLADAYEGRMTGLDIALGDTGKQALEALGEPYGWDYFAGGTFLDYDEVVLFCTINWEEEENPHGEVVRIAYRGRREVYGINLGMNQEDVRTLLGEPETVYQDPGGEDEFYLDNLVWTYNAGENQVVIVFDRADGLVSAVHLVAAAR